METGEIHENVESAEGGVIVRNESGRNGGKGVTWKWGLRGGMREERLEESEESSGESNGVSL